MIVTVTMNPAIDKTIEIGSLNHGGLNRIKKVEYDAGGKGINVSKTIRELGGESTAVGFLGGNSGKTIENVLKERGIACDFIWVEGETRTNTKVFEENGMVTELNEPGPVITKEQLDNLLTKLESYAGKDTLFVLSGSVPAGVDKGIYGEITRLAHGKGAKVLLDADGELFRKSLDAVPDMIKPNREELEEYVRECSGDRMKNSLSESIGLEDKSDENSDANASAEETVNASQDTLLTVAHTFRNRGISTIAISMGKDGAMFFKDAYQAKCPAVPVKAHSTVGAGDAMVAGLAYAWDNHLSDEETVRLCMAVSAGAVTTIGTKPPAKELVDTLKAQVIIEKL